MWLSKMADRMRRIIVLLCLLVVAANAEVQDKFKLSIGGMYVQNFETEMQIAPKGGGACVCKNKYKRSTAYEK